MIFCRPLSPSSVNRELDEQNVCDGRDSKLKFPVRSSEHFSFQTVSPVALFAQVSQVPRARLKGAHYGLV